MWVPDLANPSGGHKPTSLEHWWDWWFCNTWVCGMDKPLKPANYQDLKRWFTIKTLLPLHPHKCWRCLHSARAPRGISIPKSVKPSAGGNCLCRQEMFLVSLQSKPCICSTDLQQEDLVLFQCGYVTPKGTFADRKQLMETQKENKRRNSGACAPVKSCA